MWGFPSCFCKSCRCFGTHIGFVPNLCAWRYHIYYYVFFKHKKKAPEERYFRTFNDCRQTDSGYSVLYYYWLYDTLQVQKNPAKKCKRGPSHLPVQAGKCPRRRTKRHLPNYRTMEQEQMDGGEQCWCKYMYLFFFCKYKKTPKGRYTPDAVNCLT